MICMTSFRAVEDERPEVAVKMYIDACAMLEEDGREQMAFDAYRAAVNVYIKLERCAFHQLCFFGHTIVILEV